MVSACSRMAIAEGMTLGVKAGVAPEVLLDALSKSSFGQMRVLKDMIPNTVFPGAYDDVNFALKLLRKDVGLATELGREYHVPMMIAAIAEQQLEEALRRGWCDKDSMTFFKLQDERAGVELSATQQGARHQERLADRNPRDHHAPTAPDRIRPHRGPAVAPRWLLLLRRHPQEPPAPARTGQGARARAGEHRRGQRHRPRSPGPTRHLRGRKPPCHALVEPEPERGPDGPLRG